MPALSKHSDLSSRCARYAAHGYERVDGWLEETAVRLFVELSAIQYRLAVVGPICEIGVHLGRTFILLHLLARPSERSVAYDLYELQNEQIGTQRKRSLVANLHAHGAELERIKIVTADSTQLVTDDVIRDGGGHPRLFSLDAGRTAASVSNDLALAANCLCDGGLVSVTDCFREQWPEVSEGVNAFMQRRGGLSPVAIGGNKFFFSNSAAFAEQYRTALKAAFGVEVTERVAFGQPVIVFRPLTMRVRIARSQSWRAIRDWRIAPLLRRIATRVR